MIGWYPDVIDIANKLNNRSTPTTTLVASNHEELTKCLIVDSVEQILKSGASRRMVQFKQ